MVMWFSVVFEVPQVFIPFICWCFMIISFSFQTPGLWQEELTKPLKTVCFLRSSIASNSLKQQDRCYMNRANGYFLQVRQIWDF